MWTGSRASRSGFILAAVLMVSVVLIAAATGFAWFARSQLRRVEGERAELRSRNFAFLATYFAARGLVADNNGYDAEAESQFRPMAFPAGDAVVSLHLVPLDDALPVNALFLPDGVTLRTELDGPWETLWDRLGHRELAPMVLDFLDADGSPRLGGAERTGFLNRAVGDLSELRLCPGISDAVLEGPSGPSKKGLRHYATVWSGGKINVNVASGDVLSLLHPSLTKDAVVALMAYRRTHPFRKIEDFFAAPEFPEDAMAPLMNLVGVESVYFRLEIEVLWDGGRSWRYDAVLKKKDKAVTLAAWEERY